MAEKLDANTILESINSVVKTAFDERRSILSFQEWFTQLVAHPTRHLRSSSQYVRDVFDHYGSEDIELPYGPVRRYKVFDAPWSKGYGRVAGQEQIQQEIYRLLTNFVRDGRVTRLIMLHGPNGSAKSSIINCIQSGMEHYSHTPEGALYSYSWIFPTEKIEKGRLGFGSNDTAPVRGETYAHLNTEQIDARLPCELRDHPIFLIPQAERQKLFQQLQESGALPEDFVLSRYILEGDLSPRDRAIYDALLMANDGDHRAVLRHIQVERFYVSLKYGKSVASVEPQMHVDAEARQITADRSIANLPRALQSVPLHELAGPLVSANRGLLEFSDLLKRPIEGFKYLLTTSEEAVVSLPQFTIYLDEIFIASSNEKQLIAFKEYADWNSFKGRIELIRVPYLRRWQEEVQIYAPQITPGSADRPMAPHTVEVVAMWAVLTRLKRPDPAKYGEPVASIIRRLTPLEKLHLYDTGRTPAWCSAVEARELMGAIQQIHEEYASVPLYEGQLGASARELRTLLLNAASRPKYNSLSPLPVFDELKDLVSDPSLYEFLKQEPRHGYHENGNFVEVVRQWWLDVLDDEVRTSMGLVEETQYERLFERYVRHVSHLVKKEKILDEITGSYVDPDEALMKDVESHILAEGEDTNDFRRSIISRIGAWGLEHSGETPNYRQLFGTYIEKMEMDYYRQQRRVIAKNLEAMLVFIADDQAHLEDETKDVAKRTVEQMQSRFGYVPICTAECVALLLKSRYANPEAAPSA